MSKYRIAWRSLKTGATGQGKPIFETRDEAQSVCDKLNEQDRDIQLLHWVEPAA